MDIRGVEITNQLRSAIRAKLLELGVRYDEELPDYILVMVVNKKTRQQMNEDLNLFLEDSTEPFVDWLHDQVLKKLQKVTVAKKKNNKDLSASVNVKKEEDQSTVKVEDEKNDILDESGSAAKQDRDREFEELVGDLAMLNEEGHSRTPETDKDNSQKRSPIDSSHAGTTETPKITGPISTSENEPILPKEVVQGDVAHEKTSAHVPHNSKRSSDVLENASNDDSLQGSKRKRFSNHSDSGEDRNKSDKSKPKITSIVSVKSRLGVTSPSKKQELHSKTSSRSSSDKYSETRRNESNSTHHSSNQGRSSDKRKQHSDDSRSERSRGHQYSEDLKKNVPDKSTDLQDRGGLSDKSGTIKSRLGNSSVHKNDKLSSRSSSSARTSKPRVSSVRSRLGVKNKSLGRDDIDLASNASRTSHRSEGHQEEDDDVDSTVNTSLKSQIIAVPRSKSRGSSRGHPHSLKRSGTEGRNQENDDDDDDETDQCKVPSKVIVTPRPLRPLGPLQKHATKSLLLKAVADANKSVVLQKKTDPCLKQQKATSKITVKRDSRKGKILSVHLNSKRKGMMENIQVELRNKISKSSGKGSKNTKTPPSKVIPDEDFNVVKSLFNRSNDRQKFLVTLNGYKNDLENQNSDNDEPADQMEVNEDDELPATNDPYESYNESDHMVQEDALEQLDDQYYDYYENEGNLQNEFNDRSIERREKTSYQNFKSEEIASEKKRKLSPIVYNRSRSSSPNSKSLMSSLLGSAPYTDKRPMISSVITTLPDKSGEKCRYWPNCTLGIKCAYYHPEVSCSSFPACKFGDKCAYKHPKCKFGSACTKLNCIFSHPPIQCKYHPYCMKPGCPFSHPKSSTSSVSSILSPLTPLPPDLSSVRAKFTWKKKD